MQLQIIQLGGSQSVLTADPQTAAATSVMEGMWTDQEGGLFPHVQL